MSEFHLSEMRIAEALAFTGLSAAAHLTVPKIPVFAEKATTDLMRLADARGIPIVGPCVFIYDSAAVDADASNDIFTLTVAFPVPEDVDFEGTEHFRALRYPPFRCAVFEYAGPLSRIGDAYPLAVAAVREADLKLVTQSREVYRHYTGYDEADNVVEIQLGLKPDA